MWELAGLVKLALITTITIVIIIILVVIKIIIVMREEKVVENTRGNLCRIN